MWALSSKSKRIPGKYLLYTTHAAQELIIFIWTVKSIYKSDLWSLRSSHMMMMKWGCLNLKGIICIRTGGSGQGKKKESPSQRALWPPKVLLETSEGTGGQRQQGFSRDGLQAEEQKGWGLDPFFISNQFSSFKSFAAPLPSSVNPRLWSHTFRHSPGLDQAQKELLGVGRRLETTPSPTHPLPLKEKGLKVRAVFLPPHCIHPSTPGILAPPPPAGEGSHRSTKPGAAN